ncbi:replication protein [Escherichia coli]|nr:replication protein [Escherichia coli]HAW3796646.1 replication protein [Escherichia coli]HEG4450316.1 replication protein [Escherichia coli]
MDAAVNVSGIHITRPESVQRDQFWVKNIMSPSKLREKWDELVIRLGRSPVQRCMNHISEPDTEIPPGFRG